MLIAEDTCGVLYVGLGCDVAEVCSPPRVSTEAQKAGLRSGPVYDIKNGWDLTTRAVQDRVLQEIKERRDLSSVWTFLYHAKHEQEER